MGFERQDASNRFIKPRFGQDAICQSFFHKLKVFFHIAVKEEHITTGGNGPGHRLPAAHGIGETAHGRGVRDDQAVEAQVLTQKSLQKFRGKRSGQ